MSTTETPQAGSRHGTPIGKCLRAWRRFNTIMGVLLSLVCAIFAGIASFYLVPRTDLAARHPMEIASAALVAVAIVLLFRVFDGSFSIKRLGGENACSSSVIAVALWIACFVVISAAGIVLELKDRY
jgi:hypothetical protein